jgi:hypothetical protein
MTGESGSAVPAGAWQSLTLDALDLRLQIPAHLVLLPESHAAEHVVLGFRTPTSCGFEEVLDLFRLRPHPDELPVTWRAAIDRLAAEEGWQHLVLDTPQPLIVAGHLGTSVAFRYRAATHDTAFVGLAWAGEVRRDWVAAVYQCTSARAAGMRATMETLLGTLHFSARRHAP